MDSIYRERMNGYYPQVIQSILEFQGIIDAEYPEFDLLSESKDSVLNNAYLLNMDESRVEQWEKILLIKPLPNSTLSDRRETIIARIRGQGKLNTQTINSIVNIFTGGTARSWVENSTLYVEITPPPENKQYRFENVEQEIVNKIPAHLNYQISRNYYEWGEVKTNYSTWNDVNNHFSNWVDVCVFNPF